METVNNPIEAATEGTNANVATPKKKRRGISNETSGASNLKFHEKDSTPARLFVGRIDSVKCAWAHIGEESTGMGDFAGHSIPRFEIHFTSIHTNVNERRHVTLTLNPVQSTVETYENGDKSWQVNRVFNYIKHILDVLYLNGRDLTEEEEDALALSYNDCDDDGNYLPVEVDEVLESWRSVFENAAAMLNGTFATKDKEATGKPCYKTDKGDVRLYMKLLRFVKSGRGANAKWTAVGNNGDLAFPGFVGEGVLEKMVSVDALPKILKVNELTESITPKQIEDKKAPSMPGNMPGGMPGVMPGFNDFSGMSDAAAQAGGEMPF